MSRLRFTVIGLGGYAQAHLAGIDWLAEQGIARLEGVIALKADRVLYPELVNKLTADGVKLYDSIDHFFESGVKSTDVLTVAIGIHQHVPVSIRAMEAGLDVYCEKPVAATVQDVDRLIQTEKKTGRTIAIGFQHITSHSIQQLKERICDGRLGAAKSISVLCGWPRPQQYFTRNEWAGRLRKDDSWVLDSPANNACAHFVLNTLYLATSNPGESLIPGSVKAELYRANRIQSADLVQIKLSAKDRFSVNLLFAHCNGSEIGPQMKIICENGQVNWHDNDLGETTIQYNNDQTETFSNGLSELWRYAGLKDLVNAIQEDKKPICTPELARSQTIVINAMHESCPEITQIPDEFIENRENVETYPAGMSGNFLCIKQLDEYLHLAYEQDKMLSELDIPWATADSNVFKIEDYNDFPGSIILKKNLDL